MTIDILWCKEKEKAKVDVVCYRGSSWRSGCNVPMVAEGSRFA